MNPEEDLFTTIIEKLLTGAFICSYSDSIAFEQLESESYRSSVNDYLRKIGRSLAATNSGGAYYAVYTSIQSNTRRQSVRAQFREIVNDLEPVSRWLKLVMATLSLDASIQPGDSLKQSELLAALENSQPLVDDLSTITRVGTFQTKKTSPADQVRVVLERLGEKGYLCPQSSGLVYTATGKWDYFYEVADFIATHERLDEEYSDEEQIGLPV
ncbi:hypothetical protein BST95_12730 [Halioglobus japonicus]|uniref:Uncharacterized protein n=1 Tax=Halioglobus japonicus TaxID=930805 RepID=A0AAP8SPT1_9GAMM|nr:hypothetical protein [Halioglobus japonicus]AQA18980.1 hypothetical protein BST95_12730 [Halioglobus japonicus]PLW88005.1 hypothetical protein C0029_05455 [Halioglobus japonicus]GHD20433.1 hypothetical protein GCM10007052_30010 [Halioglobus japonicus]